MQVDWSGRQWRSRDGANWAGNLAHYTSPPSRGTLAWKRRGQSSLSLWASNTQGMPPHALDEFGRTRPVTFYSPLDANGVAELPFCLKFAPMGGKFAFAHEGGSIGVGSVDRDFSAPKYIDGVHNAVFELAWLDGDRRIATACGDHRVYVYDVETGLILRELVGHTGSVKWVAAKPDDFNVLASSARDGVVRLWDLRAAGRDGELNSRHAIYCAHRPTLPVSKREATKRRGIDSAVTSTVFLPDGVTLFTAGDKDGCVRMWDMRRIPSEPGAAVPLATLSPQVAGRDHGIAALDIDRTGTQLAMSILTVNCILTFDILRLDSPPKMFQGHTCEDFFSRVRFSPCGEFLASSSSDGHVCVYQTSKPELGCARLTGHADKTSGVDWNPAAALQLLSCSDDKTLRLWDYQRPVVLEERRQPRLFTIPLSESTPARAQGLGLEDGENELAPMETDTYFTPLQPNAPPSQAPMPAPRPTSTTAASAPGSGRLSARRRLDLDEELNVLDRASPLGSPTMAGVQTSPVIGVTRTPVLQRRASTPRMARSTTPSITQYFAPRQHSTAAVAPLGGDEPARKIAAQGEDVQPMDLTAR